MIKCELCGAAFFRYEGIEEHQKWCVGYNPDTFGHRVIQFIQYLKNLKIVKRVIS